MANLSTIGRVATTIEKAGRNVAVKYHDTVVVQTTDTRIILNNGGWFTATTKTRMNKASNQYGLGYQVYQHDYAWYVSYKGIEFAWPNGHEVILAR